ncbi:hypothetical protein [Paracoccus sp. PAMC 22219]|uniref:hypothetical protein n=1 Tax=Paracoccus sp. PAMC 22219 TaxID=1569209 RepID=UPI0005AA18C6|nr:hypothetical protein [Paracoccus sp. PAMC 22219]
MDPLVIQPGTEMQPPGMAPNGLLSNCSAVGHQYPERRVTMLVARKSFVEHALAGLAGVIF